jgi:DNA-binding CsgD family transcriptional regulator
VDEWSEADKEAFGRSVFRRRWLNALQRSAVVTVGQLQAMTEQQLRDIPNVGPKALADIAAALGDRAVRPDDALQLLGLPPAGVISERDQELVRMRQRGATFAAIARRFGISSVRVRQILERDGW